MIYSKLVVTATLVFMFSGGQCQKFIPTVTMAPNAIVLDADELEPFYNGFALVKKGNLRAVIDKAGNIVVPYGKYSTPSKNYYSGDEDAGQHYNFFIFNESPIDGVGFITKTGKVIRIKEITEFITRFNRSGKAIGYSNSNYYLVDSTGKKTFLRKVPGNSSETPRQFTDVDIPFPTNMGEGQTFKTEKKFGYQDYRTLKYVIKPQFDEASPFINGMASVMIRDEFGKAKWGFIDITGKMVIPLQFSNKPGDFHSGLAAVSPVDQSEFCAAYIDSKGIVKIKINSALYSSGPNTCPVIHPFQDGYTYFMGKEYFKDFYIIDSAANIIPHLQFFNDYGITLPAGIKKLAIVDYKLGRFYCQAEDGLWGALVVDIVQHRSQFIPDPSTVTEKFNFDEASGLRHVKVPNPVKGNPNPGITEGYLNQENQIVIIKGKAGTW